MLTKILFTALVVAVVVVVTRARARALQSVPQAPLAEVASRRRRVLAYVLAGGLLASAGLLFVSQWRSWHEVVTIKVVNTNSGDSATYRAHRGTIGARSFETVDGWRVKVSDLERIEVLRDGG